MLASVIEPARRHLAKHMVAKYLHQLAAEHGDFDFSVRLSDGTTLASTPKPSFTLVIRHPDTLQKLFDSPDKLTLGELFVGGDLDVEGDMEAALQFAELLMSHKAKLIGKTELRMLAGSPAFRSAVSGRDDELKGSSHSTERTELQLPDTMTCPTTFINSGWIPTWSIQRPVSNRPERISKPHSVANWITSAESCG
jgi:SCP-2 sterol transfer family